MTQEGGSEDGDTSSDGETCDFSRDELLRLNPFDARAMPNFSLKRFRYMALFDMERWVKHFGGSTFASSSASITVEEGLALQHVFQVTCCNHDESKVTEADRKAFAGIQDKITTLLRDLELESQGRGFFVRLGPRSPKDAPQMASKLGVTESRLRAELRKAGVEALLAASRDADSAHDAFQMFHQVCHRLTRVTNSDEAIGLLASSSRVMQDISHALDQKKDGWDVAVIARVWDDDVAMKREFRCFVVGGRLTAISQYDDQLRYEFVATHAERIRKVMLREFERMILPHLQTAGLAEPHVALVVDLLVLPDVSDADDDSGWRVRLIELNPFGPMTGSSLFCWQADRHILQGGQDLYGDLAKVPSIPAALRPHCQELSANGGSVPLRYVASRPATCSWQELEAFWPDYIRLGSVSATALADIEPRERVPRQSCIVQ